MIRSVLVFLFWVGVASTIGIAFGEIGKRQQDERRARATAFYYKHHCRPLGYVATKYDPIRTYQCDNGVYIWDHMQ